MTPKQKAELSEVNERLSQLEAQSANAEEIIRKVRDLHYKKRQLEEIPRLESLVGTFWECPEGAENPGFWWVISFNSQSFRMRTVKIRQGDPFDASKPYAYRKAADYSFQEETMDIFRRPILNQITKAVFRRKTLPILKELGISALDI